MAGFDTSHSHIGYASFAQLTSVPCGGMKFGERNFFRPFGMYQDAATESSSESVQLKNQNPERHGRTKTMRILTPSYLKLLEGTFFKGHSRKLRGDLPRDL